MENKGIYIVTDVEVTVHGVNLQTYSSDGFLPIPLDIWSLEYFVISYVPAYSQHPSKFSVVATDPDTSVEIFLKNGTLLPVMLSLHQTYTIISTLDLTGTYVKSNKPIAMYSGVNCANVPVSVRACDHLAVAIPPVASLGSEFLVTPIAGRATNVGYIIRIMASKNGTEVSTNAYGSVTLNMGEFIEYNIVNSGQALLVNCTEPCLVAQYNKGTNADGHNTDPFMMIVTPFRAYTTRFIWETPLRANGSPFVNYVNIIVPSGKYANIFLQVLEFNVFLHICLQFNAQ